MTDQPPKSSTFAYSAITSDGQKLSGSIDALNESAALRRLQSLQLSQIQLKTNASVPNPKPLRGEDFLAFNQQLAQLTGAGLPVEQGLRMIAAEMRRGSMQRTLDLVAAELESGKTLPEAVAVYREKFPPLYAQLIDAGIRAGNLSGILLNLGRHLTLVRKLQAALWQALSYPVIVMCAFFGVLYFILVALVPKWEPMLFGLSNVRFWVRMGGTYQPQDFTIPWFTTALFNISTVVSSWPVTLVLAGVVILAVAAWAFLRATNRNEAFSERLLLPLPLIGSVLRRNLISRWCHAVALAVEAGLDLPAAITLADDATASPRLSADGAAMIASLNSGHPLSTVSSPRILPPTVVAAMEMSSERGDLPLTLRAMAQMYQEQAELRLETIQAVLTPIILVVMGLAIGDIDGRHVRAASQRPQHALTAMESSPNKTPPFAVTKLLVYLIGAVGSLCEIFIESTTQSDWAFVSAIALFVFCFFGLIQISIRLFWATPPDARYSSLRGIVLIVASVIFWSVTVGLAIAVIGFLVSLVEPAAGPMLVYALAFVVILMVAISTAGRIVRRRRMLLILSHLEKAVAVKPPALSDDSRRRQRRNRNAPRAIAGLEPSPRQRRAA